MLKAVACTSAAALTLPLALLFPVAAGSNSSETTAAAGAPTVSAKNEIPSDYLRWYQDAAQTCPGLPWNVLAAIGSVESDHGRSQLPGIHSGVNSAGAGGPMQFLAATWATYGIDGDHDGRADRYNPADAIYGAAHYLCANGAGEGGKRLYNAIFRYNHADWYVRKVLAQAAKYAAAKAADVVATGHAGTAVRAALHWLGTPYSWGGGGPAGPSYGTAQGSGIKGFDCSGLTQHAWAKAGIRLPRIAADQFNAGPHIPRSRLQPGDLVFFATTPANPHTIHHVGIYLPQGRMIHAPHTGDVVRISRFAGNPYREREYAGATRPGPLQTHQT
ncbi:C40 family peptidase [Actinomadura xylanilytica]|uniref:C40 family peptidase n=1 Tax=Actinomadura xylanilytica TaxID=887459 RepID=UPI00255B1A96|nr:NlpC/P60 family protein [Actinomadura xylanilytica]MDL4770742.1 NlpC/P60 family protein [Actinomadura xylanilytica]